MSNIAAVSDTTNIGCVEYTRVEINRDATDPMGPVRIRLVIEPVDLPDQFAVALIEGSGIVHAQIHDRACCASSCADVLPRSSIEVGLRPTNVEWQRIAIDKIDCLESLIRAGRTSFKSVAAISFVTGLLLQGEGPISSLLLAPSEMHIAAGWRQICEQTRR